MSTETFTDKEGRSCRRRLEATLLCPRCGKEVELYAETEEWIEKDGRRIHSGYGPATGNCCEFAFLDYWEGTKVFEISGSEGR